MKLKSIQAQQQKNTANDPMPASILHPTLNSNKSDKKQGSSHIAIISDITDHYAKPNLKHKQKKVC